MCRPGGGAHDDLGAVSADNQTPDDAVNEDSRAAGTPDADCHSCAFGFRAGVEPVGTMRRHRLHRPNPVSVAV
ncbi:hypothetical protein VTK26DRAFT_9387 [Humicola hyalothermophila]